jgi:glycosyltransferase involved in cell wall biosynthesis
MSKPMTVYTLIPHRHSASFEYRLRVPLDTAAVLGLPVKSIIDVNDAGVSAQERIAQFCEADIVYLYQPVGEQPVNNFRGLNSFLPSKRDGEWKYPPSIIVESDDNIMNVSPLNQAFKSLGIRDMDGNLIPLGHHIGVVQDGEKKVLWKDGENGFSLAKNRQTIASWRKILEMADQVQCSTPHVAEAIQREVTPRRLRVFPNLMRLDHYPQVAIQQEPDKIKILWQGGIAHYEDWYPLREALGNITKRYPEVHWIIWGAQYPWVNELIPPHRYTFHDWCPYQEYKLRLVMMDHDISLAPLSDNVFNKCRSAIKWYEASVLRKPAATLAQNTGPYRDEIEDNRTGLLFNDPKEFEDKLSLLIEDVKFRREVAANAKDWVSQNRDAMKEVPKIIQSWEEIREERRREQPRPTDAQWEQIVAEDEAEQRREAEAQGVIANEPVPALNESG